LKIAFLIPLVLLFVVIPVYGGTISDATGLVYRLDVETGGRSFEIKTVSNFSIPDYHFDEDKKSLTIYITSGLENNLSEIMLPQNLLSGNFTFYLNDQEYFPQVKLSESISFITLNFTGSGDNKLEIIGSTYLDGLTEEEILLLEQEESLDSSLMWIVITGSLIIVAVIVLVIFKKKNKA
jgi:hypothetical protein